jgi:hypothetical protein
MNFAETYLTKHNFLKPQIIEPPMGLLSFIVVIPVYLEDGFQNILESLYIADRPNGAVEVIAVFNTSEADSEDSKLLNRIHFQITNEWAQKKSDKGFRIYPILVENLPKKHAGAGLARKIGMDEAIYRFGLIENPEGIILSLDADTKVDNKYFTTVNKCLNTNTKAGGCIIPFLHPLKGDEFKPEVYEAIASYELHMRYYKHILNYTGFPHAYYTLGSCFGVKAKVYSLSGGMNRRKAGEDFYFLHKLFPHFRFIEAEGTIVYPSPRPSFRVPFGTGPAVQQMIRTPGAEFLTYSPESFEPLKKLFNAVPSLYSMSMEERKEHISFLTKELQLFLSENDFLEKLREIAANTSHVEAFIKRFYLWFDGFRVVKCLNFMQQNRYKNVPVQQAAIKYLEGIGDNAEGKSIRELLDIFRRLDGLIKLAR